MVTGHIVFEVEEVDGKCRPEDVEVEWERLKWKIDITDLKD